MAAPTALWTGKVSPEGRLVLDRRDAFRESLHALAGQRVEVTVRKARTQRSNQANRYYWGVVITLIADALGYTPEEAHEAVAFHLLRVHEDTKLPRRRSTATLSVEDFARYVEDVKRFAASDLGVFIPDANTIDL